MQTSAIILAAGNSSRMGEPKLSLKFDEKFTFIEKAIKEYIDFGCKEIIVVINKSGKKSIEENNISLPENTITVINEFPELGRFYSLKLGCNAIENANTTFLHIIDNPFVNQKLLKTLFDNSRSADYIIPSHDSHGGHPVLVSEKIINAAKSESANELHFKEFLNRFSSFRIEVDDKRILANINDWKDYEKWVGV